jgi:hypothetical protein
MDLRLRRRRPGFEEIEVAAFIGLPCVIGGGATSAAMYYVNQ